jgi:hypothetical protein
MALIIGWIILSVIVSLIGGSRKIGSGGALLLSILLSPLIGLIITLASPSLSSIEQNEKLLNEQKRMNDLISAKLANPKSEELKVIQRMRMNGTLSEDEYEKLRIKIVKTSPLDN